MASQKEQYRKAIAELIDSICPYKDAPRQRIYHIGFMQSLLAEIYEEDPRHYHLLKRRILRLRNMAMTLTK